MILWQLVPAGAGTSFRGKIVAPDFRLEAKNRSSLQVVRGFVPQEKAEMTSMCRSSPECI